MPLSLRVNHSKLCTAIVAVALSFTLVHIDVDGGDGETHHHHRLSPVVSRQSSSSVAMFTQAFGLLSDATIRISVPNSQFHGCRFTVRSRFEPNRTDEPTNRTEPHALAQHPRRHVLWPISQVPWFLVAQAPFPMNLGPLPNMLRAHAICFADNS